MSRKSLWMLLALAVGATACAEEQANGTADPSTETPPEVEEGDELGSLALSLAATDSQGRQYRLRNADFTITRNDYWYPVYDGGAGGTPVLVSSESDPSSHVISVKVLPGDYMVGLSGDWYLERTTPTGTERVQKAILLSPQFTYAYVQHGYTAEVEFRFGVDGDLIDFRHGDINIRPVIELPGESDCYGGYYPYDDYYQMKYPPRSVDGGVPADPYYPYPYPCYPSPVDAGPPSRPDASVDAGVAPN